MPEAISGEEVGPPPRAGRAIIKIGGMSCAVCAGAVEGALRSIEGVAEASVSLGAEKAVVVFRSGPVPYSRLKAAVEAAGYSYLGVEGEESERVEREARERELRAKLLRGAVGLAFGAPLMALSLLPHELWHGVGLGMGDVSLVMLLVSIAPFAYTSGPIFSAAHRSLRARTLSMDVMYAMGIGVAYVSSAMGTFGIVLTSDFMFYDSALLLAAFLMFGKYLEARARGRTSEAIKSLLRLQPKTAVVVIDGRGVERRVEDVGVGEVVLVRPGERVPVDGTVVEGESFVDESMMTGEPMPVHKAPGSPATGGTLNGSGALMIRAERVGSDTALARIIRMVEEAQLSRPRIQRLADRAVAWFIPFVLFIAISSLALWYLVLGMSLLFSLGTLISVLVIACPCALGLATPTAVTVGVGRGAELGILIRNSEAFETSEELTMVVFDKTGTLTRGRPEVTDVIAVPGVSEAELLRVASGVERGSTHPIAEAVLRAAGERGVEPAGAEGFRAHGGRGASATLIPAGATSSEASGGGGAGGGASAGPGGGGEEALVGNMALMDERGVAIPEGVRARAEALEADGRTTVFVSHGNRLLGVLGAADALKESSKRAVAELRAMGLGVALLTGDNRRSAEAVAGRIGIERVMAGVLPGDKAGEVARLQARGEKVAFVGDGINDAPALAKSDVGIAIGSGTDVAIESARIVLVRDEPMDAVAAIRLARKVMARIKQNIFWAFAYNASLIPLAAGALYPVLGVTLPPELAGLAMAMSSVTVVSLSLMLRRYDPLKEGREGRRSGRRATGAAPHEPR